MKRMERLIDREVRARFPPGAVRRVALRDHEDDRAIEPGELVVRVSISTEGDRDDEQASLDRWAEVHDNAMKRLRRELSLRLPAAKLLEFTIDEARNPGPPPLLSLPDDPALTEERLSAREIVRTALGVLRADYVFPEVADQAAIIIEERLGRGDYDDLDDAELAGRVTRDLYELCQDKHLSLRLRPRRPAQQERAGPALPGPEVHGGRPRPFNFGIFRAERLEGNVGYLDLRGMADPDAAGPVIAAAMELVGGTYALIIDVRHNRGGSPQGVVFWCSYLFPDAEVHLNDIFEADSGMTRQFWSLAWVPGQRYLDRPVYLLTSAETFSGGEDFCYSLQAQGRSELIGETTGGGAHPTRVVPISSTLALSVPFARSINPITGTNWQGTGVVPDVQVPAAEAYDVAYGRALRHVLSITVPLPVAEEARAALARLSPAAGLED
jgi:hypothetical protein